jgi:hypothetical protein
MDHNGVVVQAVAGSTAVAHLDDCIDGAPAPAL